jgi:PII-like signaling protein
LAVRVTQKLFKFSKGVPNGWLQNHLFTQQDRRHGLTPIAEWLLLKAKSLGLHGATLVGAGEGFGHDGKLHSAHFSSFQISQY